MADDLCMLMQALSPYAGNANVAIVASPAQAMRMRLCAELPSPPLMSNALAPGNVVAVAVNAVAAAVEPPRIDAAKAVEVHEEDTTPQPVGTASPGRSVWQTDCIALRLKMPARWCVRDSRAVATVTTTKW